MSINKQGTPIAVMASILELLPPHITHVAFDNEQFISRAAFKDAAPLFTSTQFDKHLEIIQSKAREMEEKAPTMNANFQKAAVIARQLQCQLELAKIAFLKDGGCPKSFKTACLSAINQARPVLETDGGWTKHLLSNFGIANFVTRRLGFFHAQKGSGRELDAFELAINKPKIG